MDPEFDKTTVPSNVPLQPLQGSDSLAQAGQASSLLTITPQPRAPVRLVVFWATCLPFAVLALWLVVTYQNKPDQRNTPELLLASHRLLGAESLPPVADPHTDLTDADLAFGEQQVLGMVQSRPEMVRYVSKNDAIWQFCVRAFAGEAIGERIYWDSGSPQGAEFSADHFNPYGDEKARIRIRKESASGRNRGRLLSCEELWACVVFEIENLRNHRACIALYERAIKGEVTREQWIFENSRLEYEALRRTSNDYVRLWQPLAASHRLASTMEFWGLDIPPTYEAWISMYNAPAGYPWNVFGEYFDHELIPYLKAFKRWQAGSH